MIDGDTNLEAKKTELSSHTLYARISIRERVFEAVQESLGIALDQIECATSATITDLQAFCVAQGIDADRARRVLEEAREAAFFAKYEHYSYEEDLRGLVTDWVEEIRQVFTALGVRTHGSHILDVGVGNGLEIASLFPGAPKIQTVDLSRRMLEEAVSRNPQVIAIHNPAEDLRDVAAKTIDLYVSFRTFQSSLFDITAAIREAKRALKRHGAIVVSVANGFVDVENGNKKIVRGLLVPGSHSRVDRKRPFQLTGEIATALSSQGFEPVSVKVGTADIYIYGRLRQRKN